MENLYDPIQTAVIHLEASTGPLLRNMVHTDLHIHLAESRRGPNNLSGLDMGRFPIKSLYSWPIWCILTLEAFHAETYALLGSPDIPGFHKTQFKVLSIKIQPNTILGGIYGSIHLPYLNFTRVEDRQALDLYWSRYLHWLCGMTEPHLYGVEVLRRPSVVVTVKRLNSTSLTGLLSTTDMILPYRPKSLSKIDTPSDARSSPEVADEIHLTLSATPSVASSEFDASSQNSYQDLTPSTILGSLTEEEDEEKDSATALAEFVREFDAARAFHEEDDMEYYPGALWEWE